jgi:hypothetical protein
VLVIAILAIVVCVAYPQGVHVASSRSSPVSRQTLRFVIAGAQFVALLAAIGIGIVLVVRILQAIGIVSR